MVYADSPHVDRLQVHFVHKKASYSSIGQALSSGDDDALAVLGFFFQVCTDTCIHMLKLLVALTCATLTVVRECLFIVTQRTPLSKRVLTTPQ